MLMIKGWATRLSQTQRAAKASEGAKGFTLIEVILFFSISGLLVITLLGGVTLALNTQRYQDAVLSFKNFVQDQYASLQYVANDRDNTWSCPTGGAPTQGGTAVPRGQSDCFLMGRVVVVNQGRLHAADIIGSDNGTNSEGGTDIDRIKKNYTLNTLSQYTEDSIMEWGTEIACRKTFTDGTSNPAACPRTVTLLLLRSPESGVTYTFTNESGVENPTNTQLKAMILEGIAPTGTQGERVICVNTSNLVTAPAQWIYIRPYAVNSTGVETRSVGIGLTSGDKTKC